jgi:hypothetical protein
MRIELTLQLRRSAHLDVPADETVDELLRLGGWPVGEPEDDDDATRLTFVFADRENHDRFLKAALRVPGVSL